MNRAWRHTFPLTALFPSAIPIGSQRVRAICPDPKHVETHPSCIVNYDSTHGWKWHCFSCGADGDALDVLTGREGMGFAEAMGVLSGGLAHRGSQMAKGLREADAASPAGNTLRYMLGGVSAVAWPSDGARDTAPEGSSVTAKDTGSIPAPSCNFVLICDACRNETAEFGKRAYRLMGVRRDGLGVPDRPPSAPAFWTASADLELATLPGWELSAGLQFAVGPKCLERIGA